jgi:hypothetical protein
LSGPSFPIGIALVGVVFFGVMAINNFVRAYRKKEKFFYGSGAAGLVMVAVCILAIFGQYLFVLIIFIILGIVSAAAYPKIMKMNDQEYAKQVKEVDVSAPLRWRDFRTIAARLKLASKYGVLKATLLYEVFIGAIISSVFFILGASLTDIAKAMLLPQIISSTIFYRRINKALTQYIDKKTRLNNVYA